VPSVEGKLIALEGLDGSGQTTQSALLVKWLMQEGYRARHTKEPTDGPAGSILRLVLGRRMQVDKKTLAMLFLADRIDHQHRPRGGLLQLLGEPRSVVVSDRYYLSSFAYQVLEPGIDIEWLHDIHRYCLSPALTVYIDVSPRICIERIARNRGLRFELFEAESQLVRIRENYRRAIEYLRERGENVQVIDGEGTPRQVAARIRARVQPMLLQPAPPEDMATAFSEHAALSSFRECVLSANLQIVQVRRIANAYQVRVADSSDLTIPVNFFDTGRVRVQGTPSRLRKTVCQLVQELAAQAPSLLVFASEDNEDQYVQRPLFD
jgi:dTMP kinase